MAILSAKCPRCESTAKLRPRDFSDQAIATLVAFGDLDKKLVGQPCCDECYGDLRDLLIEHQRAVPAAQIATPAASKAKRAS
jgi:hypothetical protein